MTKLILIRHGYSEANEKHCFAGHSDADLTEQGLRQAEKTAEFIAENYKVDAIYSSDLKRAYKTAEKSAEKFGLEIIKTPALREIYAGDWEMKSYDELEKLYPSEYSTWRNDIGNAHPNGGESVAQLGERVCAVLEKIVRENPGKTIVAATHATPIRVSECIRAGSPLSEMKEIPWVANASVTVINFENGYFEYELKGEDSFLEEIKTILPKNV